MAAAVTGPFSLVHAVDVARADRLHYRTVRTEYDIRDYRRPAADEEKASALDPYNPYVWNVLGSIYLDVGVATRDAGLIEEARNAFTRGLGYLRQDPSLTVSLTDLEIKAGRPQEAIRILTAYLENDDLLEDAHFNMGLAYLQLGLFEEAAERFETCVRLVPTDAEAYYYLSEAYWSAGQEAKAEAALQTARVLDPEARYGDQAGGPDS